jgi:hypothetical protein
MRLEMSPLKKPPNNPESHMGITKEDHFNSVRVIQIGDLVEELQPAGYVGILKMLDLPNFRLPTKVYKDSMGGRFFELRENQDLPSQFFTSQVLKGFLPVCELVQMKKEDQKIKFFSYVPPRNDLDEKVFDPESALADNMILHIIMGDMDHKKNLYTHGDKLETIDYSLKDWQEEFIIRIKALKSICLEKLAAYKLKAIDTTENI